MDKNLTINQVKSKQDAKRFLQQFVDRKAAVVNCIRERRPLSELESQGINVAKNREIFSTK